MVVALKLAGTLAAAVYVSALWSQSWALLWGAWVLLFVAAEGLALALGTGTLSAHVWALRDSKVALYAVLGSAAFACAVWLAWHFGIERDHFPGLRQSYRDDGWIAAVAFVASLVSAAVARAVRRKP